MEQLLAGEVILPSSASETVGVAGCLQILPETGKGTPFPQAARERAAVQVLLTRKDLIAGP